MNIDETGIPARGRVPSSGIHLVADAMLPLVGEIATMTIRTGTAPVDLTGTTEIGLSEAWTITPPRGMTIHGDGGTMENVMRG